MMRPSFGQSMSKPSMKKVGSPPAAKKPPATDMEMDMPDPRMRALRPGGMKKGGKVRKGK